MIKQLKPIELPDDLCWWFHPDFNSIDPMHDCDEERGYTPEEWDQLQVNGNIDILIDTSIDLSKVVFGLPMLAEKKSVESYKFTASYFAPVTNTRIIFVSSKDPETQVKYGISNDGQYIIKSDNPNPIILENVGHYEITFDLLMGTYDIKALDKKASQFDETSPS